MSSAENIKESGKAKKQKNGNKNNNKKPSAEAIPLKNSPRNKVCGRNILYNFYLKIMFSAQEER